MTNQEREEFELVAKACGYKDVRFYGFQFVRVIGRNEDLGCDVMVQWNPKTDDGDALRLAVKLKYDVCFYDNDEGVYIVSGVGPMQIALTQDCGSLEAATRLAIWRAAVEYARSLK